MIASAKANLEGDLKRRHKKGDMIRPILGRM